MILCCLFTGLRRPQQVREASRIFKIDLDGDEDSSKMRKPKIIKTSPKKRNNIAGKNSKRVHFKSSEVVESILYS